MPTLSWLLSRHGMLKIGDLYRQEVQVHAWRFCNGRLLENMAAMLSRGGDVHEYATRVALSGIFFSRLDTVGFTALGSQMSVNFMLYLSFSKDSK